VLVEEDAIAISKIEVKKSGMDESTFIQIFTERSSAHLAALASAYHKMFRKELRKVHFHLHCVVIYLPFLPCPSYTVLTLCQHAADN
jgi:hypothetical protein